MHQTPLLVDPRASAAVASHAMPHNALPLSAWIGEAGTRRKDCANCVIGAKVHQNSWRMRSLGLSTEPKLILMYVPPLSS